MLNVLVGSVDLYGAIVLVAFFLMITIVGSVWLSNRRSRQEITNDFELAKIKQADAHEEALFARQTDRSFKIGQLDKNLITSHSRNNEE